MTSHRSIKLCLCLVGFFAFMTVARAGTNSSLVYQGRIVRPDGYPVNSGLVTFTLSVYSPAPSRCLLYSEVQALNMSGSSGMFSLVLGVGTRTDGGAYSLAKVFVNGGSLSGLSCASGNAYSPNSDDDRDLKVSFNDSGTVVNLAVMPIKSIPFALQAHEIDGWGLNNLVKVSSVGSPTTFTTTEMANVKMLGAPSCATNEILKWNGSAWTCSADATGGSPADAGYTGAKGVLAFDTDAATSGITVASGIAKLSNTGVTAATYGTASKVASFAVNAQGRITSASEIAISMPSTQITGGSASTGDVLKWNGSAWLPAADATGTSPGDASYAAKGLVQGNTDAATSGLNLSSGVISVNSGTAANQIVKLDVSAKLPAVDGSQLTNLSLTQIASGTLPVSKGGTGSAAALSNNKVMVSSGGAIVEGNGFGSSNAANTFVTRDASGNFAAGVGTFDSLKLNGATSGTLTLTAPSSFTNFSLNFPSADGSAGQFLKTDGSGNLTWGAATAPGDATYAAKGLVQFNTDAATSGISVASGVATVNFGTGANQIVKLDASSKLPAVDGSALTNLNANNITAGTLPISRGGTGASTKTAGFDALSPNSAKGDITVHNGTNNISLPRGSDGQVLTTDSAQASGLKWSNPASGTVMSVTGGTGLTGGTITSTGTLAVNVGTGGNQIVQLNASSKLPAVDGSQLTNLSAAQITAGTLPVTRGGTGLVSGTSGGIPYFSSATTMASSGALTANGVVLGGGAGVSPNSTAAGTADQVLRVPAGGGAPAFGAIDLSKSAAVTGTLAVGNGGTGSTSYTANGLVAVNGTGAAFTSLTCTSGQVLKWNGTSWNCNADDQFAADANNNLKAGTEALNALTTGAHNTVFGYRAGYLNQTGNENVAIGREALRSSTVSNWSIAIGAYAQYYMQTASGDANNIAIGGGAMQGSNTPANNTGKQNIAIGQGAVQSLTSGAGNIGIGDWSLNSITSGYDNVGMGFQAGDNVTTGHDNTFLGANAILASSSSQLSFATAVGASAQVSTNNTVVLGRTSDQVAIGQTGAQSTYKFYVKTDATNTSIGGSAAWTNTSDGRFKTNVQPIQNALEIISRLQGVRFDWDHQKYPNQFEKGKQIGFIAQQIEPYVPEIVRTDENGYKGVQYSQLVAVLTEAVKELHAKLQATMSQHDQRIARLEELKRELVGPGGNGEIYEKVLRMELRAQRLEEENQRLKLENSNIKLYLCLRDPHASLCQ